MKINQKKVEQLMKSLGCTEEEAISIIQEDEEIDSMPIKEVNSDLTAEQKKAIKSVTKTGTKKQTAVKRERKIDETKKQLINGFGNYLILQGAIVEPLKTEAEMHFTLNGENYTIKLIKHRPPKK